MVSPTRSVVAACTNKTSFKTRVPQSHIPKTQQGKQAEGMFGCGYSHVPAAASLKPLQQKSLWDGTYSMKLSWKKLDYFSRGLKGICLSQSSFAVAIPSLFSTTKLPAHLPSLQKGEGPFSFLFFNNFLCINKVLVRAI